MNAQLSASGTLPGHAHALLRTLVITDLVDSTALVERLGDQAASELLRGHDRLLRGLIRTHRGQEIDKTDGFLSLFERPIQAVAFALDYQRGLQDFAREKGIELKARVGIHVGEVMSWHNEATDVAEGAKPMEVEGLAKPVAARLMGLAMPGQILLSGVAYTLAHRAEGELGSTLSRLKWMQHGLFRFKGVAEAVPVYEIGEPGIAAFKSPAWSGKAHREVPLWRRPAMLALEALLLLTAIAVPAWHLLKPTPAIAFAQRDWIVVADLRNLSSDARFDESLAQALRMGLEQSQHINVISTLRERETLGLMQLDPDSTVIDRAIGTQLALREGARALILPTVAEVGERLRFTLEVVEPSSQTTVMSLAADGNGVESVLTSVDEVSAALRQRLGESLGSIESTSVPLLRAATPEMDALRAYSLARIAVEQNRLNDALALAQQALEIDPEFAAAHVLVGTIHRNTGNSAEAVAGFRAALAIKDRLSTRERLTAESLLSSVEDLPVSTVARWRTLTEMYPEDLRALAALGHFMWTGNYDLSGAEAALRRALRIPNTPDGTTHYTLGTVLLGMDRPKDALDQFDAYEKSGRRFENQFFAAAHASLRDFSAAGAVLDRGIQSGVGLRAASSEFMRGVFLLDEGYFGPGLERIETAAASLRGSSTRPSRIALVWSSSVAAVLGDNAELGREISAAAASGLLRIDTHAVPNEQVEAARTAHMLAWFAARSGQAELARDLTRGLNDNALQQGHPVLRQHAVISNAVTLCSQGDSAAGLSLLRKELDQLDGLYSLRIAVIDCLRSAGDPSSIEPYARWLSEHRGRAYAEMHSDYGLIAFNVTYSNLALLDLAESLQQQGRQPEAIVAAKAFKDRWRSEPLPLEIAQRLNLLLPPEA